MALGAQRKEGVHRLPDRTIVVDKVARWAGTKNINYPVAMATDEMRFQLAACWRCNVRWTGSTDRSDRVDRTHRKSDSSYSPRHVARPGHRKTAFNVLLAYRGETTLL